MGEDDFSDGGSEIDFGGDPTSFDPSQVGDSSATDDFGGDPTSFDPNQVGNDGSTPYDPSAPDQSQQDPEARASAGGGSGGPSLNRSGQTSPAQLQKNPFQTTKPAAVSPISGTRGNPYGNLQPRPDAPPTRYLIPIGDRNASPSDPLAPIYRTADRGVYDPTVDYSTPAFYGVQGNPNNTTQGAVANANVIGGVNAQTLILMGVVVAIVLALK